MGVKGHIKFHRFSEYVKFTNEPGMDHNTCYNTMPQYYIIVTFTQFFGMHGNANFTIFSLFTVVFILTQFHLKNIVMSPKVAENDKANQRGDFNVCQWKVNSIRCMW